MKPYRVKAGDKVSLGDIVYRHPLEGERAFLCRQPSLHLYSISYMKVKPCNGNVICLNNAASDCYNADYDGD